MSTAQLVERLHRAHEAGDAPTVLALLDELAAAEPHNAQWPYNTGVILQELGDLAAAQDAYRRAVEVDDTHADAWINLGRLLDDDCGWDEALICYDRALALVPDDEIGWANRGNTLMSLERFDESLESFERALAVDGRSEAAQLGRQTVLAWTGRLDEANAIDTGRGEVRSRAVDLGHHRLVARYFVGRHSRPDLLDAMAEQMVTGCARFDGQGAGLADGVRIGWGWSALTVREQGRDLVLCEPGFTDDPWREISWDVSFTLQTSLMHSMTLDLVGAEPSPCSMQDAIVLAPGILAEQRVVLRRFHATDDEGRSGWVVGPADPEAFLAALRGDLDVIATAELARYRPHLIKVLVLPPDWVVLFDAHRVVSVIDPDGQERFDPGD